MGYASSTVRLNFPDLSSEGDLIWVDIRNPRQLTGAYHNAPTIGEAPPVAVEPAPPVVPAVWSEEVRDASGVLTSPRSLVSAEVRETVDAEQARLRRNHDRARVAAEAYQAQVTAHVFDRWAAQITGWHVYDAVTGEPLDDGGPVTGEVLRDRVPNVIGLAISAALREALNPS